MYVRICVCTIVVCCEGVSEAGGTAKRREAGTSLIINFADFYKERGGKGSNDNHH